MPALTRRRDPHRPDRWDIYFGDVAVGSIGRCAGVPVHVDQWEWAVGPKVNTELIRTQPAPGCHLRAQRDSVSKSSAK
jgi:hypothetical protein